MSDEEKSNLKVSTDAVEELLEACKGLDSEPGLMRVACRRSCPCRNASPACGYGGGNNAPQPGSVDEVMAAFDDAIAGCTAGLTNDGLIDQNALAATGWTITKKMRPALRSKIVNIRWT